MEAGHVAKLDIKVLLLKHDEQAFNKYEDEIQYLIGHEKRNKFISNLALDLKEIRWFYSLEWRITVRYYMIL